MSACESMNKGGTARLRPLDEVSFYFKEDNMKIYDELVWRGLIKDISSPELEEKYLRIMAAL